MAAIVVNDGLAGIVAKLNANTPPRYVAWGTGGGTAEDPTDEALNTEAAEDRVQGANSVVTEDVASDTYQVVATITSLSTQTISEVGLLTADAAGDLYVRGTFTGIPLDADDSIQFTIKQTLGQPA